MAAKQGPFSSAQLDIICAQLLEVPVKRCYELSVFNLSVYNISPPL